MNFKDLKKEITLFLSSEEAKMLKKDVAKLGLTASIIATIMAQTQEAEGQSHADGHADGHSDSHTDALSHGDSHSDGDWHTDSHSDGHVDSHVDSHTSHSQQWHDSRAVYDTIAKKGGHFSEMSTHSNY